MTRFPELTISRSRSAKSYPDSGMAGIRIENGSDAPWADSLDIVPALLPLLSPA